MRLEKVGDFDQPLYVTQPPGDDRHLFVVEKTGRVQVVRDGQRVPRPFLDLSDKVSTGSEQGLLSLAFAPDYRRSGLLYVDYTDTAGDTRVVEYRRSGSDPLVADPQSAREILTVDQPYSNHNGGLLLFGPGRLARGRSRPAVHRARRRRLRGRPGPKRPGPLDPARQDPADRSAPLGRPPLRDPELESVRGRSGARPEIYSYGLRNPWRFSFDPATGALAIADVGQNEIEEVNLVGTGPGPRGNFGWSAYEGLDRFNDDQQATDALPPVLVYGHDAGCSITGGYVVRDRGLRSLYGRYLYGDFCAGQLRSFAATPERRATDDRALGLEVPSLSSFGQDNAGHLYATSLLGPVYRLAAVRA